MARLIVLDASVVIAALAIDDAHHAAAVRALDEAADDDLVLAATTRAEVLVGPARRGADELERTRNFVDGCETVPVTGPIADRAAVLRARQRALSLPDAFAIVVGEAIEADAVWTFDHRWGTITARAQVPQV